MVEDLDPGSANANDCWSDGVVRWRARKIRHARGLTFDRQAEPPRPRSLEPGRYEGEIPSYGKVSFEVRERAGRRIVSFETRLELYCESIYRMTKLGPFKARLHGSGRFDRPIFLQHNRSKHRFFTWITGRIRPSGEATGRFAHFDDPWDPEGRPNVDECVTPRELPWRAERVG